MKPGRGWCKEAWDLYEVGMGFRAGMRWDKLGSKAGILKFQGWYRSG